MRFNDLINAIFTHVFSSYLFVYLGAILKLQLDQ